jgi:hypothetical protein
MENGVRPFEIERIRLEGIRGFRRLDLAIRDEEGSPRRRTLLIGKNGTCKSTLLRAIALGLATFPEVDRFLTQSTFGRFVASGRKKGSVEIGLVEAGSASRISIARPIESESDRENIDRTSIDHNLLKDSALPSLFVCGLGAGRHDARTADDPRSSYLMSDSVESLFGYEKSLLSTELVLRRLRDFLGSAKYLQTLLGIQRVLDLKEGDQIFVRQGGGVAVSSASVGGEIPFESWADGYRLTFTWLLDLFGWAMRAGCIDEEGHISGILLIDEIEQHLHPAMQAEILPRLSELLPKMQIFATTHSPLVALDAHPSEVVVLRREGTEIVAAQSVPDFRGYSAEDMLTDPRLFDSPAYGDEKTAKLDRYHKLAAVPKAERDASQTRELRELATEILEQPVPESRDSEVARVLRELVAKHHL